MQHSENKQAEPEQVSPQARDFVLPGREEGSMTRAPLPPPRHRYRMGNRLRRVVPGIVWVLLVFVSLWLYPRAQAPRQVSGLAQSQVHQVGASQAARILRIDVREHERVRQGQVLGRLFKPDLDLELITARARLAETRERLDLEAQRWQFRETGQRFETSTLAWRVTRDRHLTEIEELRERTSQSEDKARLAGIAIELDRLLGMQKEAITSDSEVNQLRTQHEALQKRVRERLPLLESLAAHRKRAMADFDALAELEKLDSVPERLEHAKSQLKLNELEIQRVELALSALELRAPRAGLVAKIRKLPGEWVMQGETIFHITDEKAKWIEAWIPENRTLALEVGSKARVRRQNDPNTWFETEVVGMGIEIQLLPPRMQPGTMRPAHGLPITLAIPADLRLRAGESLQIALH